MDRRMPKRNKLVMLFTALTVLGLISLLYSLHQSSYNWQESIARSDAEYETVVEALNMAECPRWFTMAITLKKCLSNKIKNAQNLWEQINNIAVECGVDYVKSLLHSRYLLNRDDIKVIIPPRNENARLVALTVGIGNDMSAELRLQSAFPKILFYGADPILEDGKVFESIGKYLQVGVSKSGGVINGSALINGSYVWHNINTVKISHLIKMFRLKIIDYLFLDVEGPEYDLLPEIVVGKNLEDVIICQINVEVHGPVEKYGVTQEHFDKILSVIVSRKSQYIPLWIPLRTVHQRFLLVNWQHSHCIKQFFDHWC